MSRSSDPRWAGHVDDVLGSDLQELLTAAEAVESLLAHPGWDYISRLVEAEAAQVSAVTDGRLLPSRSDYAFAHGRIGGLRAIKLAAEAILARAALRFEQQRSKHESTAESVPGGRT